MEIECFERYKHPFTAAYLDLDNFKAVYDQLRYAVGEKVLCTLVNTIQVNIRKTYFVARLGGDEFIVLFPETDETLPTSSMPRFEAVFGGNARASLAGHL